MSSSVANSAVFFFIGNHSGLALMVQTVKNTSAAATLPHCGESSVKAYFFINLNSYTDTAIVKRSQPSFHQLIQEQVHGVIGGHYLSWQSSVGHLLLLLSALS